MLSLVRKSRWMPILGFLLVVAALMPAYLSVLQTIPNGADNGYMADVGETQIVLNVWGTLHATGYPLFIMTGATLVTLFKALGVTAATAPALVSMFWGLIALALIYMLALHLSGRVLVAAAMTLVYGLTRTVWIHHDIAEVYTFGLAILALLFLIALWRQPIRGRVYWLALLGGIGVAEHRALVMVAPALVFAVWSELTAKPKRLPLVLAICLLLGLIGFLPYVYLPLRANAGAAWVYGEPGTLSGLWDQFTGREASRFIGLPSTREALAANFALINTVLVTDLTIPGLLLGALGLVVGVARRKTRHAALTLILSGLAAYIFHVAFYTDVLFALILPVTLTFAFGWLFAVDWLFSLTPSPKPTSPPSPVYREGESRPHLGWLRLKPVNLLRTAVVLVVMISAVGLIAWNLPFIESLTSDRTGLQTIALAHETPSGATLMIAWGPRHFAVGFDRDVLGDLRDIRLVSHKADFKALVASGPLVTPDYTFYNQPVEWWQQQLGRPVFLHTVAPNLIQITTQPELAAPDTVTALGPLETSVTCDARTITLKVAWAAPQTPTQDLSVFVHLLDAKGAVLAQADQSAPVYGRRPLTSWQPNEIVRDLYPLPRKPGAATISYGLYHQLTDGSFDNVVDEIMPVDCN